MLQAERWLDVQDAGCISRFRIFSFPYIDDDVVVLLLISDVCLCDGIVSVLMSHMTGMWEHVTLIDSSPLDC
jgi:hypothetical protein